LDEPLVRRELARALEQLPEDYRTVMVLADIEELSYREIAEVVGCPIGTVMSRLHRARRAMRTYLEAENAIGADRTQQADRADERERSAAATEPVSLEHFRRGRRST
jgi:RNA polymerase sigma-70 factor (ECF subfamily)